jgi:cell shape-determining protein MreC
LVARFSKEKSLIKRIKLKREINNIEKLRTKVLNSVAKDEKINDIIKREIELTNMLFKKYFDYKEDPKKLSKELKEKLNVSDEFTNLERRLDEYYDSFGKSATATIYGASSIIK